MTRLSPIRVRGAACLALSTLFLGSVAAPPAQAGTVRHDPPPLTISSIFAAHPPSLAAYDQRNIRTIIATGDVIPARSVNYKMTTYGDFAYPFRIAIK